MLKEPETCIPINDRFSLSICIFICIFIVISYLPQHYRIIANKTSQGFSPWFFFFGVVSSTSRLLRIVLLQWNSIVAGQCFEGISQVTLVGIEWIMFFLVFLLFLFYFPENKKKGQLHRPMLRLELPNQINEEWKITIWITWFCIGFLAISIYITVMLLAFMGGPQEHWRTNQWASFLDTLFMMFDLLLYIPQTIKIIKLKTVGALSISAMVLQSLGPFIFISPLVDQSDINWVPMRGFMKSPPQISLLVMCIILHFKNKKLGIDDLVIPEGEDVPSERTQLLER